MMRKTTGLTTGLNIGKQDGRSTGKKVLTDLASKYGSAEGSIMASTAPQTNNHGQRKNDFFMILEDIDKSVNDKILIEPLNEEDVRISQITDLISDPIDLQTMQNQTYFSSVTGD